MTCVPLSSPFIFFTLEVGRFIAIGCFKLMCNVIGKMLHHKVPAKYHQIEACRCSEKDEFPSPPTVPDVSETSDHGVTIFITHVQLERHECARAATYFRALPHPGGVVFDRVFLVLSSTSHDSP